MSLIWMVPVSGVLALIFVAYLAWDVLRRDTGSIVENKHKRNAGHNIPWAPEAGQDLQDKQPPSGHYTVCKPLPLYCFRMRLRSG